MIVSGPAEQQIAGALGPFVGADSFFNDGALKKSTRGSSPIISRRIVGFAENWRARTMLLNCMVRRLASPEDDVWDAVSCAGKGCKRFTAAIVKSRRDATLRLELAIPGLLRGNTQALSHSTRTVSLIGRQTIEAGALLRAALGRRRKFENSTTTIADTTELAQASIVDNFHASRHEDHLSGLGTVIFRACPGTTCPLLARVEWRWRFCVRLSHICLCANSETESWVRDSGGCGCFF